MNIVDGVLISVSSPPKDLVISGVRVIGERALQGVDIESVDIRDVVEIRARAFMECTSLRRVKLPTTLRKIARSQGCKLRQLGWHFLGIQRP